MLGTSAGTHWAMVCCAVTENSWDTSDISDEQGDEKTPLRITSQTDQPTRTAHYCILGSEPAWGIPMAATGP